jgi:hypothetical protein
MASSRATQPRKAFGFGAIAQAGIRVALVGFGAAVLCLSGVAQALTVSYAFEGVVTSLVSNGGLFGHPSSVQLGDTFTGRFSYEVGPANPDQAPDPQLGFYNLTEFVIDQSLLPPLALVGVGITHEPGLPVIFPNPPNPGRDWFSVTATSSGVYPLVRLRLAGPFDSVFSDDSLPETLDLADFPDGGFVQGLVALGIFPAPSIEDLGMITSLSRIPEPGVLSLLATGLIALGARRRLRAR